MIRITVPAMPTRRLQGKSNTTGKPYDLTFQTIYAHTVDEKNEPSPFPEKTEIVLDAGQAPYASGVYQLSPASVYVDRNGRLAVAPKLVPVAAKA